jgi:transposase
VPIQLSLRFADVPMSCPVQERYHAIAPCLAGQLAPARQAAILNVSYATITRWIREFRERGMPGLFHPTQFPRGPYTPERLVVLLVYFKCCAPKASDRELARLVASLTGHRLHNETVRDLLDRYFFWRYPDFRDRVSYPVPADPLGRRLEMVRLHEQGLSERTIASLLQCTPRTVRKWLRRHRQEGEHGVEDRSRARYTTSRKVFFGTIQAVLRLQQKYGYAGAFRIRGYLERDYGIAVSERTVRAVMRLNRTVHLAPARPAPEVRDSREGPPVSHHPFQHTYIDIRYLDAKPEGVQLYSTLLLEGRSRTILGGSLTRRQDLGVVLRLYYLALLEWGCWEEVISDHGSQFRSHAFTGANRRLGITHTMYEKGHPWQNLIESQFGIQARLGEYHWERCRTVEAAVEFHRELIRDHNRLPHFAHRQRNDGKHAPLDVLGQARGQRVEAADLHRAFSRKTWKRMTDARGFIRVNRWKIYIEEGLPRVPVQVTFWDGKLRAEHEAQVLAEYRCRWDAHAQRPKAITSPTLYDSPFRSRQATLFDPLWVRDPIEHEVASSTPARPAAGGQQLRLYLGPELVT